MPRISPAAVGGSPEIFIGHLVAARFRHDIHYAGIFCVDLDADVAPRAFPYA